MRNIFSIAVGLGALLMATTAAAHPGHVNIDGLGGFLSGFLHPFLGWDHVVAMLAVGLWGAFLGQNAVWALPVIFPLIMVVGGALGLLGVPVPGTEVGIAVSALVLGALVALAARLPLYIAGAIVGIFAIFHGYAHGTELPAAADALHYSIGFVLATGLLHLCGIFFALLSHWPWGGYAVRLGGGVIALLGIGWLAGMA